MLDGHILLYTQKLDWDVVLDSHNTETQNQIKIKKLKTITLKNKTKFLLLKLKTLSRRLALSVSNKTTNAAAISVYIYFCLKMDSFTNNSQIFVVRVFVKRATDFHYHKSTEFCLTSMFTVNYWFSCDQYIYCYWISCDQCVNWLPIDLHITVGLT